jgi:hypothetical protein
VLDFVDEATLNEAIAYLEQDLSLDLLVRDFMVSGLPVRASALTLNPEPSTLNPKP